MLSPAQLRILTLLLFGVSCTLAHGDSISLPNGETVEIPEGVPAEMRQQIIEQAMKGAGGKKQEKPKGKNNEKKTEGDGKKKDGEKDKKKGESNSDTITRPKEPKNEPDKSELDAMPIDGRITLQFQGHPWPAMIQWYSRATGREIEWQKLPAGFINLRTQRPFTMKETGDLINRLLLARGYTILDDGDFMQVVSMEGINPAFVPRVDPRQLATLSDYSFVRTSIQLQRFKAEDLAKELEAMKSKHGKLVAMSAANRIEAMDTVRNLRDIYAAIDAEQSSGSHAPREFEIQYLQAAVVKKKIEEMFAAPKGPPLTPQQIQQMQQQQQQNRGQKGKQPPKAGADEVKISIVVNELRNSIIVKTAPNVMVDVAAAIKLLDVELTRDTLDIKAYTLATRSPQEVADILSESGALSPSAIVRVDKKTKTLLVSGSKFDHFKIEELIKKVDGNARRFVSIPLRRYPAVQVATTIENMMGKPKEEKKNNSRRYYYSYWDNDDEEDENPNDVFRVTADTENNRLILKCNDTEYEMVIELLTQMGEVMTRSKYAVNEVVLDGGFESEDDLLERVRQIFNSTSDNEVILPPPVAKPLQIEDESDGEAPAPASEEEAVNPREVKAKQPDVQTKPVVEYVDDLYPNASLVTVGDHFTDIVPRSRYETRLTQVKSTEAVSAATAPPIIIRRNRQGKLVIRSDDPAALEKFEEILRQMAPPPQDWVHFRLKHVTALWMKLQLKDFFDEEDEGTQNMFVWDYWGDDNKDEGPPGLGDEKKMRFIDDGESTLVVRNASAKQLATVKELIALYDVAEPPNEQNARFKEIIQIQYSKARVIETTLKDAFRDLLSSNDKAFAQQKEGDEGESRRSRIGPFSFSDSSSSSSLQGTSFKGKISFGVDESTNRLIVTAEGKKLLEIIVEMVKELDVAAVQNDDTRVTTLPAGLNSQIVRQTLTKMFGPEAVTVKPQEGQENGQQGQPENGNDERRRNGRQDR